MDNYQLLEKYRKKLSVYFTLFVLFSFWVTQIIFLFADYIPENWELEKTLDKKFEWVVNIIQNYDKYIEKINNSDTTLWKIMDKTLENTRICSEYKDWECIKIMIDNIQEQDNLINYITEQYFNYGEYKYLKKDIVINNNNYNVIIKIANDHSIINMLKSYVYFILFSIPFSIAFYFIWYFFVWKNFKPINETISGLEDFTSNINHEMKTPLSEIITTLSLAKKIKNYDDAINQSLISTKKLSKILDSMLWIVNILDSSYKKEKIDLIKQLNSIIKYHFKEIEKKDIKIEKKYGNNNYFLNINKEHFDICVWNILKNAIKYSEHNWTIKIVFNNGVLEIIDNWIWISKNNLKNIFDRYFRENYSKEEWYGIWLSIVKKIVDIHSWKIYITSRKKKTINSEKWTKVKISFL